jgi:hypothetical protein
MTNEELHEYYGWKAYKEGFFEEWREKVAEKMNKYPRVERSVISFEVFSEIKNKKDTNEKK